MAATPIATFFRNLAAKVALYADVISEFTAAAGVTIDGLLVKDGGIGVAGTAMSIAGNTKYVTATCLYGEALALDGAFFVANRAYKVESIIARPLVAGPNGSAVTALITKAPSGTASAAGMQVSKSLSLPLIVIVIGCLAKANKMI
jgi:hypothetical protein